MRGYVSPSKNMIMKNQFTCVRKVFLFLLAISYNVCQGQILSYTNATAGTLNSVATNATGTALTRVNGAASPGTPCSTGFSSSSFTSTTTYSSSLAAIETSVTPASGYTLNVTGFSVGLRRSSTGPASVRFAYSTDGGITWTDQGSNQSPNNAGCGSATTAAWTTAITVSDPSALKFRVYGFNASSSVGTFQILNLTINGTVTSTYIPSCDSTLWSHVYNPTRLAVINTCTTFTGIVAHKINEADGDVHIRVTPDTAYSRMINSYNISGQHGDMVVEPVCAVTVTQSDAIASCTGFSNTVYIPNVGEHVQVTGSYVTDTHHGWNEIHPVTSITILGARGSNSTGTNNDLLLNADNVKVFPNPATATLHFALEEQPYSVVYITLVDGIGRLAGQYQMLQTRELTLSTTYLPAGKYYYSVVQNNKVVKGGTVIIQH